MIQRHIVPRRGPIGHGSRRKEGENGIDIAEVRRTGKWVGDNGGYAFPTVKRYSCKAARRLLEKSRQEKTACKKCLQVHGSGE